MRFVDVRNSSGSLIRLSLSLCIEPDPPRRFGSLYSPAYPLVLNVKRIPSGLVLVVADYPTIAQAVEFFDDFEVCLVGCVSL